MHYCTILPDPLNCWHNQRRKVVNKYGPKAQKEVEKAMHEYKRGELKSSGGDKVTSRKQAVAIGLSKARAKGAKAPKQD